MNGVFTMKTEWNIQGGPKNSSEIALSSKLQFALTRLGTSTNYFLNLALNVVPEFSCSTYYLMSYCFIGPPKEPFKVPEAPPLSETTKIHLNWKKYHKDPPAPSILRTWLWVLFYDPPCTMKYEVWLNQFVWVVWGGGGTCGLGHHRPNCDRAHLDVADPPRVGEGSWSLCEGRGHITWSDIYGMRYDTILRNGDVEWMI